jgi:hypothetical protein
MPIRLMALCAWLACQACSAATVYKVVGPDGKVSFTDQPPATAKSQALKVPVNQAKVGEVDRDPVTAAMLVHARQMTVESTTRFCMTFAPRTAHDVVVARDAWRLRNGALIDKKNRMLATAVSLTERSALTDKSDRDNEDFLETKRAGSPGDKLRWCQTVPASFASPDLDLSRNPTLVRTVMDYKGPDL